MYFKGLAYATVGLSRLKHTGWAGQLETQGRADVAAGVRRPCGGRIPSSSGDRSLLSLRPSAGWMRPTHMMERDQLHSKSIDGNVKYI